MSELEPEGAPLAAAAVASLPVEGKGARPAIWGRTLALPLLVAAALVWFTGEAHREEALVAQAHPAMRVDTLLPSFELTERSGQKVSSASLAGKPYIAAFVFTRCQGPCPVLTSRMRRLQDELDENGKTQGPLKGTDVRLVSFSVDPTFDTPEVLSRYAKEVSADPARWLFLTGDSRAVTSLVGDGFHLGVARNPAATGPSDSISHDTHLALVDAHGRLCGYYDSNEETSLAQLEKDARWQWALTAPGRSSPLPLVNAILNGLSAILLLVGYAFIRAGNVAKHKLCMMGAFVVSAVFLGCYLAHHAQNGSTPFAGVGTARNAYFALLASHVILAVVVLPFELATLWLGLKGRLAKHVTLARATLPIWVYVSVTGVAVYLLLYRIYV